MQSSMYKYSLQTSPFKCFKNKTAIHVHAFTYIVRVFVELESAGVSNLFCRVLRGHFDPQLFKKRTVNIFCCDRQHGRRRRDMRTSRQTRLQSRTTKNTARSLYVLCGVAVVVCIFDSSIAAAGVVVSDI